MSAPPVPGHDLAAALVGAAKAQDCLLVGGTQDPVSAGVRERAPDRFVAVAGGNVRAAVAAGAALAGRRAVAFAGGDVPARLPVTALPAGGGLVAVTAEARVAAAAWGAGWTLVQPAWPADLPVLLEGALAAGEPAVLRPPAVAGAAAPATVEAPRLGVPRVLHEGTAGLVAASGAAVPLLAEVARMLAERGVAVQALELHTCAAGEGPGPDAGDRPLFVGELPVDRSACEPGRWPPGLRPVVGPGDAHSAMERVAAHLRARP